MQSTMEALRSQLKEAEISREAAIAKANAEAVAGSELQHEQLEEQLERATMLLQVRTRGRGGMRSQ